MRATQFVGLTANAQCFVSGIPPLQSDGSVTGIGGEQIVLQKWVLPDWLNHNTGEGEKCIREVLQDNPWSNGPMFFTCLEIDFGNNFKQRCFEWIHDPSISYEYDYGSGRLWV